MHLSALKLWNFRKYCEGPNGEPGLVVNFHEGVNVLIGEMTQVRRPSLMLFDML